MTGKLLSVYSWKAIHKRRARDAKLAALVTPELAELLERLAIYARQAAFLAIEQPSSVYDDEKTTLALAAKIRETLDDNQA